MNNLMDAYVYDGAGGPEVIKLQQRPIPDIAEGEVLIKVAAFGLNRADVQQRKGVYPPPPGASDIPGLEVSGIIQAVGKDVENWKVGDKVAALLAAGGYAQYVAVPAGQLFTIPESLSFAQAAALPEVSSTVVSNLFIEGQLQEGQNVLIHGGSGGIGSMAIQLANAAGARVIVTASSQVKIDYCRELGADEGINYKDEDVLSRIKELTDSQGVDLILDVVGAKYLELNLKALAVNGKLVIIGLQGGAKAEANLGLMLAKRLRIIATTLRSRSTEEKSLIVTRAEQQVLPLLETGELDVNVSKIFEFNQLVEAHEYFDSGVHTGKIIVEV